MAHLLCFTNFWVFSVKKKYSDCKISSLLNSYENLSTVSINDLEDRPVKVTLKFDK
jgi:hypothetical protein